MYEVMFVALALSVPLWLIVDKLSDIGRYLQEWLYEDDDEGGGEGNGKNT